MPSMIEKFGCLAGRVISSLCPKKKDTLSPTEDIKKILVVKIWATGEVLLTTPAIRSLRKAFPKAEIDYLVGMRASEILSDNHNIDNLIIVDEKIFIKPDVIPLIKLMSRIRKRDYDLCVLFHHTFLFVFLFRIALNCVLVGIDRKGEGGLLDISVEYGENHHQADEYLGTVLKLGCKRDNLGLEISIPENEIIVAKKMLTKYRLIGRYIVIAPGGGENPKTKMPKKLMPLILWRKLLLHLLPLNMQIVIIGGMRDIQRARKLSSISSNIINLTGITNIMESSVIIKRASLIITNDSLPLHIASALKIPTVAIFGPTSPNRYGPYENDRFLLIKPNVSCAPCYKDGYLTDCIRILCWENTNIHSIIEFTKEILKAD